MEQYESADGKVFDDADVERWAAQAEAGLKGLELTRTPAPWRATASAPSPHS
ncbi:hypothetical protein [Actinomyces bovis]|uniref:hypothetical protein n=1 Tax=Actinomyces bovis TaxID=1658 RepID=UPI001472D728|nr:hypothetical protein [Actinomyces bovis]